MPEQPRPVPCRSQVLLDGLPNGCPSCSSSAELARVTDARLRMAIARACKATGTPHFSPHGLRRRRGSLHYKRTGSLAEVAELLGDSKRVAADHYVYALTDYREVDRTIALARAGRTQRVQ
jgi:integrase